jgi:hypothetical protein
MDGDGDMDVLSASFNDDKIAWYENDANQNFATHIISTDADGALDVVVADVDGDADLDVLSANHNDDNIAWYENKLPEPRPHGGLDDLPREPFAPPLPAPPSGPTPQVVTLNHRIRPSASERTTTVTHARTALVTRLSAIKRLADVDWSGIHHDMLPVFGEW